MFQCGDQAVWYVKDLGYIPTPSINMGDNINDYLLEGCDGMHMWVNDLIHVLAICYILHDQDFFPYILVNHCPPVPYAENTTVDSLNTSLWSTITYTCTEGHRLADHTQKQNISCSLNLLWNAIPQDCEGKIKCEVILGSTLLKQGIIFFRNIL